MALFLPGRNWTRNKIIDVSGTHLGLADAFPDKKVRLSVCPPDDVVEEIKTYVLGADRHCLRWRNKLEGGQNRENLPYLSL